MKSSEETRRGWMQQAVALAVQNVETNRGGPFGALIVKDGECIASGTNLVTHNNDPTAHAEIVAIREACRALGTFQLDGSEIYTNCEPCPMCLGAIFWSRINAYYFCATRADAAAAGFDDAFIYDQLLLRPEERAVSGVHLCVESSAAPFEAWARSAQKIRY